MPDSVLLQQRGNVAWIVLNRPHQLNALNEEITDRLSSILDQIETGSNYRAMVFSGNGRAFSSGGDLQSFLKIAESRQFTQLSGLLERSLEVFSRIENSPIPSIAAVNGLAVAGGFELLLCCDVVIAAESAKIGDGHLKYGVLPGGGGSVRLPRKVPHNVASFLLMSGELLPAADFVKWGVVNHVVPDKELEAAVTECAETLAKRSPLGLKLVKQMIKQGLERPYTDALRNELRIFAAYVASDDFREGMRAFSEKRAPAFTGQ